MNKEYYTINELAELGFPKAKVRQLCHSDIANLIALPRTSKKGKFLINKAKLEKYWGWQA